MTPELVAAIAAHTRQIGDRLEAEGVADPHEAAERLVRWMQQRGWRLHLALADRPTGYRPASPAVAKAAIAEARAAVKAKCGPRPENSENAP